MRIYDVIERAYDCLEVGSLCGMERRAWVSHPSQVKVVATVIIDVMQDLHLGIVASVRQDGEDIAIDELSQGVVHRSLTVTEALELDSGDSVKIHHTQVSNLRLTQRGHVLDNLSALLPPDIATACSLLARVKIELPGAAGNPGIRLPIVSRRFRARFPNHTHVIIRKSLTPHIAL
jgi:hypothetical protein